MPARKGTIRRPNSGPGTTVTESVSFDKGQRDWLADLAQNSQPPKAFSYVVYEAIEFYRNAIEGAMSDDEKRTRRAKATAEKPSPSDLPSNEDEIVHM